MLVVVAKVQKDVREKTWAQRCARLETPNGSQEPQFKRVRINGPSPVPVSSVFSLVPRHGQEKG